ncbi:MAG: Hsp20/alpha crystallin family protein [Pseudomonadota bacterium]
MKKRRPDHKNDEGEQVGFGGGVFNSLTGFINTLGDLAEAGEKQSRDRGPRPGSDRADRGSGEKPAGENSFSRILSGLTDIAEKLNDISEKGETLSKEGKFTFPSKGGGLKGVYGFTLKTGLGGKDDQIRVEPFGNIRKDKKTGEAVVQEIHEPPLDVFEDELGTTLIAEMPGVGQEDIRIEVRDDVLTVLAKKGGKKYRKEILLHHSLSEEKIKVTCNNGIVTIRCEKT